MTDKREQFMEDAEKRAEEEKDYPTDYSDGQNISDAKTWLNGRTPEEIEAELNTLHHHQLEWMGYVTDNKRKKTILRQELEERDEATYNSHNLNDEEEEEEDGKVEVWDSGLEIIDNFKDLVEHELGVRSLEQYAIQELGIQKNKVLVPEEVRKICVAIQNKVNKDYGGGCEFGVLFKGEWTDKGFLIKPDYVIPEQKVSRAHITYDEDLKKYRDEGYIVNIHSHPWAGQEAGFSGTDDDHINSHFDMAVLFAGGAETLVDAVANVEVEDGTTVQISPEVVVEQPEEELPNVNGMENVETKKRATTTSNSKRGHGHKYYTRGGYNNYKKNNEDGLPQSPEETDSVQRAFTEIDYPHEP